MNRRLRGLVACVGIVVAPHVDAQSTGFDIEGRYQVLQPPQLTETGDRVEVVDVFWYGCPHCYTFLSPMEAYEKVKPDYVEIRRMPAIFRDSWDAHARAYYTAMLLGVTDRIHRPLFEEIHEHRKPTDDKKSLGAFFERHGVDRGEFERTFDSFAVESLARKSVVMQKRYGITGTPSVVVNGKYRVTGQLAGSHDNVIAVIRELVERERHQAVGDTVTGAAAGTGTVPAPTVQAAQTPEQPAAPAGGSRREERLSGDENRGSDETAVQPEAQRASESADAPPESAAERPPSQSASTADSASQPVLQPWHWVLIGVAGVLLIVAGRGFAGRRRRDRQ